MNNFRKRLLAALLSFVMVFLSMSELFTAYTTEMLSTAEETVIST